jgi:hypothetical protein
VGKHIPENVKEGAAAVVAVPGQIATSVVHGVEEGAKVVIALPGLY